jgi:hypothetical protein
LQKDEVRGKKLANINLENVAGFDARALDSLGAVWRQNFIQSIVRFSVSLVPFLET